MSVEENDIMGIYFKEVGRNSLLRPGEEVELSKIIEQGRDAEKVLLGKRRKNYLLSVDKKKELARIIEAGEQARQKFIKANLKLVISIAKRYADISQSLTLLDLIQEGNLGLFKAVERFDWRKKCKFSIHARWWIRESITRAISNQARIIRISVYMVEKFLKCRKAIKNLFDELGREPLAKEIALKTGLKIEEVDYITKALVVSLETFTAGDYEKSSYDFVEHEGGPSYEELSFIIEAIDNLFIKAILKKALTKLTEQEREVILMRFGGNGGVSHTQKETGLILGLTRDKVRQIQRKALNKLAKDEQIGRLNDLFD